MIDWNREGCGNSYYEALNEGLKAWPWVSKSHPIESSQVWLLWQMVNCPVAMGLGADKQIAQEIFITVDYNKKFRNNSGFKITKQVE